MTSPSEILSQDEVDALLKGVNGDAPDAPEEPVGKDGVRPYDLANPERSARGRMPTLDIINERFTRLARVGIYNLTRRNPDVTAGATKVQKFSDFLRNLVVPTNLNICQLTSLKGQALVVFEPSLVMSVVDTLFGGHGRYHVRVEGRDFTATEQRIIERLVGTVLDDYQKAWAPVHPLQLEYVRSEMNTHFANITSPSDLVVTSTFNVDMGSSGGSIHVCIPYSALEPLRDVLASLRSGTESDTNKRWTRMLSAQVQQAEVELAAPFARVRSSIGEILKLKAGDVIPLELAETIGVEAEGVPVFECRYGTSGGRYALKIERVLAPSASDETIGTNGE